MAPLFSLEHEPLMSCYLRDGAPPASDSTCNSVTSSQHLLQPAGCWALPGRSGRNVCGILSTQHSLEGARDCLEAERGHGGHRGRQRLRDQEQGKACWQMLGNGEAGSILFRSLLCPISFITLLAKDSKCIGPGQVTGGRDRRGGGELTEGDFA